MERERFDAVTRLFAKSGTRRAALGALLGAGLLGTGLDALASNGKSKRKGRGGEKNRRNNRKGVKASSNDNANLGNSVCAKWCQDNYDGKEAGQCTAAAAKGEGPCYECGGPQAEPGSDCCVADQDCCAPQVCNTVTQKCVVQCGSNQCDPSTQKCCSGTCIPYDVCCTGNLAKNPPVPGVQGVCLPRTNAFNAAEGDPHVELVESTEDSVTLRFHNDVAGLARFEVRIDGERLTCGTPHLVVIGDFIYPGPSVTPANSPVEITYSATSTVEVRLALGGERDWDFESNQSSWVTFNVGA